MRIDCFSARGLALVMCVAGCGGGDGGSGSGGGAAPPTGSAPQPPPPPPPSAILPPAPFGLTSSQQLPLFGWAYRKGSNEPLEPSAAIADLRWSAEARTYELSVTGVGSGTLEYRVPSTGNFKLIGTGGSALPVFVFLDASYFDPPFTNTGSLYVERQAPFTDGELATVRAGFGRPTATGDIPLSGQTRYLAGSADLTFDFSQGTLQGSIPIAWVDAWGPYEAVRYQLTDPQYERGGTRFSATFIVPGAPTQGTLEGQFMGPQGQELVIRWRSPILNPYSGEWTVTSDVWFGKPY